MNIKDEIEALKSDIEKQAYKYYVLDSPEISDYEYDMKMRRLRELEEQYPEFKTADSPTLRVGGKALEVFDEVIHEVPLQSLNDVFSFEELEDFDRRVKQISPLAEYALEMKIDGLSVSIEYRDGILYKGATRGDGTVGEDVTENIKTIGAVPLSIKNAPSLLIIRGEVYMPRSVFDKLNKERENKNLSPFANPRNAAAGSLRQLDSTITAKRQLSIYVFNIQRIEGIKFSTHSESLEYLRTLGFKVNPIIGIYSDINDAYNRIIEMNSERQDFDYDTDGAVLKVNQLDQRDILGNTAKAPRWASAFKYPPEEAETKLISIEVNVGRTGVLTPFAVMEPVRLSGTIVSKATLHNRDFIKSKDIRVGDTILVRKAGEIIPEILSVVMGKRSTDSVPYEMPKICPICGSPVYEDADDAAIRCTGASCPAQLKRNIMHFASRDAMDIEGLGEVVASVLVDKKLVKDAADIYRLTKEDIAQIDGFKEKSTQNLINAIEESKTRGLSRLIYAFGIHHIGQKGAKIIAGRFKTLENLMNADIAELSGIFDIGPVMAQSICDWADNPSVREMVDKITCSGVITYAVENNTDSRFEGKIFVLTGSLKKYTRQEASDIIESRGGKVSSSVSKKTSYVIAGDEAGTKLKKAEELNVRIISESDFDELLQ